MVSPECSNKLNIVEWLFNRLENKNKVYCYTPTASITYADLEKKIKLITHSLKKKGVMPGQRVVIGLNDGIPLVGLFFSCLAMGACPILINPRLTTSSLKYILTDSMARVCILENNHFQADRNELLPLIDQQEILLISQSACEEFFSTDINDIEMTSYYHANISDLTVVQYTSGTTGQPKGIMHSAYAILSSCELFAKMYLKLNSNDILYSIPKTFFGYGFSNSLFFPFYMGASAILDEAWPTTASIANNIKHFLPTVLFAVPTVYKNLIELDVENSGIDKIRLYFSAGAHLPQELFLAWQSKYATPIYDGLGATEMYHVFLSNNEENFSEGSTGKIVPGYQYKLVNSYEEEVLLGEQGVMLVNGPTVALGYLGKQELTLSRFKEGWYRTGDIFVEDAEGFLYYKGREDDLFKVKGRWIVPAEIELYVKKEFSMIRDAFLVPGENDELEIKPVLFLGMDVHDENITESITRRLAAFFESYKVPVLCVLLTEFPYNDNGKILRKVLSQQASELFKQKKAGARNYDNKARVFEL